MFKLAFSEALSMVQEKPINCLSDLLRSYLYRVDKVGYIFMKKALLQKTRLNGTTRVREEVIEMIKKGFYVLFVVPTSPHF